MNDPLDERLEHLPDDVADALLQWRVATLEREKTEALLLLKFKGGDPDKSATELKAMVQSDDGRFEVCLKEARAESFYQRLYERLMAAKKEASLRTAF